MTNFEKIEFLLDHGYVQYSPSTFVKKEWLDEPEGGPNHYRILTLNEAWKHYIFEQENGLLPYKPVNLGVEFKGGWNKTSDVKPADEQVVIGFIDCPAKEQRLRILKYEFGEFTDLATVDEGGTYNADDVVYWMPTPHEP